LLLLVEREIQGGFHCSKVNTIQSQDSSMQSCP
jgi:hypothetical protein